MEASRARRPRNAERTIYHHPRWKVSAVVRRGKSRTGHRRRNEQCVSTTKEEGLWRPGMPLNMFQRWKARCARNTAVAIAACRSSIGSPCRAWSCRGHRRTRMNCGASRSYPRRKRSSKFRRPVGDSNRSKSCRHFCGRTPPSAAFIPSRPVFSCWMTWAMRRASVTVRPPSCL